MSFFNELKRRHVFKVGIAYIVVAWLILQVSDVVLVNIGVPDWVFKVILLLLCIGLPLSLLFAWAFDMTPEGLKLTDAPGLPDAAKENIHEPKHEASITMATAPQASVAVLPFVNMSGDLENEYFSDGLSEELLNVLSNIDALKVAARTSSFHFKGQTGHIADIAQSLGVANVLEGSVRQSGARIRITCQLINAVNGYHLWSETFDRELTDIFAVQDEIASAVAVALKVKLLGEEVDCAAVGGTQNTKAFQAYLKGVHHYNKGSDKAALKSAVGAFEEAIRLDPGYAKAHAGLAFVWDQLATNSFVQYEEGTRHVKASATRAIELAPELADGYLVLGRMLLHYKLDHHGARKAINKAFSLSPNDSEVLIEYARISSYFGDVDASVAAARKSLEIDPVSKFAHHFLGHVLYFGRRYDEAIPVFRHILELDPQYPRPRYTMGMCMYMLGDVESALAEVSKETLSWMKYSGSAILLHRLGRIEEAEEFRLLLIKEDDEGYAIYQNGQIYAQWGELDQSIKCLNRARELGDPGLSQLLVDPLLEPVRNTPGYDELLDRTGFKALKV